MEVEDVFIEKYRPKYLKDIVGQDKIIERFKGFAKTKTIPHMMLAGKAGTGKTTSVLALLREIYGKDCTRYFLEINASDEGGVNTIRKKVKDYIDASAIEVGFKVVFLDECDALTQEAQAILRRTMEKYSYKCRFALSCNYPHKIIEPIQDRCAQFRFKPIKLLDMLDTLKKVSKNENITITPEALTTLAGLSKGSMRKPLNVLNTIKSSGMESVSEEDIYSLTYWVNYDEIKNLLLDINNRDIKLVETRLKDMIFEKGYNIEEILEAIGTVLEENNILTSVKLEAFDKLEEVSYHITRGANPYICLRGFCAHLMKLM